MIQNDGFIKSASENPALGTGLFAYNILAIPVCRPRSRPRAGQAGMAGISKGVTLLQVLGVDRPYPGLDVKKYLTFKKEWIIILAL
jgi:hypothetical protein